MSHLLQVKGKGKYILRPAQSGSEVTMYIQIKARKIHFVSGSIWLRGYNVHTNKSKENTFCVRLNLALRLQCTYK